LLSYIAISNHAHLLVKDQGGNEIANSMQLIAARDAIALQRQFCPKIGHLRGESRRFLDNIV